MKPKQIARARCRIEILVLRVWLEQAPAPLSVWRVARARHTHHVLVVKTKGENEWEYWMQLGTQGGGMFLHVSSVHASLGWALFCCVFGNEGM